MARDPLLDVQGLQAWWGGAQAVFDLDLQVSSGELVVLQGLNGAGKSTLLQALMGVGPRSHGQVLWCGQPMSHWPAHRRAQAGLAWVAEDRRLFTELTVQDNLMLAARAQAPSGQTVAERLAQVLDLFPALRALWRRPAAHMSGGEQQMLAIARSLMTGPRLLMLDEPCEGIAPVLVEALREALLALAQSGMTLLVAEHNQVLARRAHRVLHMAGGRLHD